MQIDIFIDPEAENRYRAYSGAPFPFTAEGETRYEAVQRPRQLIQERLDAGAVVVQLDIPASVSRVAHFAGSWKPDDPFIEEWRQAVEEYRRQVDADPNVL
jgi:hypothetical protein